MAIYKVTVVRTSTQLQDFEVEADSVDSASDIALSDARCETLGWDDGDVEEYEVETIECIEPDTEPDPRPVAIREAEADILAGKRTLSDYWKNPVTA